LKRWKLVRVVEKNGDVGISDVRAETQA
jgi:hypothetical protein